MSDEDTRTLGVDPSTPPSGEAAGDRIDRYVLLKRIGEGGMGAVWLAEQSEPIRRHVALKIIKLGMDTREVVARFEAERQALARMDHPHIAKVLDGGATSNGRPYFVMEHVHGAPITQYCDEHKLTVRGRLELFDHVCSAIQHAHQKGIIHRDIKPSNVLVSSTDHGHAPMVIDFGIAKAVGESGQRDTLVTRHGQVVGTLEYMAPEQADPTKADVDTRADVYSLGVLLYELLTGVRPFNAQELVQKGYSELLRTISEVDPPLPSQRVSALGQWGPRVGADRRSSQIELAQRLRGDLDWIVMKALEKERERRYESPTALAADLRRSLRDEPVEAAPPSAAYRFRKLMRRRRKTILAASAMLALLIAGSIGTGVGWWRSTQANEKLAIALEEKDLALANEARERTRAEENERTAREQEQKAEAARELAEREAQRATDAEREEAQRASELERVAEFQVEQIARINSQEMGAHIRQALLDSVERERRESALELFSGANFTNLALGALRGVLFEPTLAAIDAQFADQPLVQAQLLHTLSVASRQIGLPEFAVAPGERALALSEVAHGRDDQRLYAIHSALGVLLRSLGEYERAEPHLREASAGYERTLGADHRLTLGAASDLAELLRVLGRLEEADELSTRAVEIARSSLGKDDPALYAILNHHGLQLQDQKRFDEAELFYREALEGYRRVLGDEHRDTLTTLHNLGFVLLTRRRSVEAEGPCRESLEKTRRVLGDAHPDTLSAMNNLAIVLEQQARYDESNALYHEALRVYRATLGDRNPGTLAAINNLSYAYVNQGRLDEALPLAEEVAGSAPEVFGWAAPQSAMTAINLGMLYMDLERWDDVEALALRSIPRFRESFGPDHPMTVNAADNFEAMLARHIDKTRENGDGRALGEALLRQASCQLAKCDLNAARPLVREALTLLGPDSIVCDEQTLRQRTELGLALARENMREEALPLLSAGASWSLRSPHASRGVAVEAVAHVVELCESVGEASYRVEAESWRKRLAERESQQIDN